jgi:hypothetical protein
MGGIREAAGEAEPLTLVEGKRVDHNFYAVWKEGARSGSENPGRVPRVRGGRFDHLRGEKVPHSVNILCHRRNLDFRRS